MRLSDASRFPNYLVDLGDLLDFDAIDTGRETGGLLNSLVAFLGLLLSLLVFQTDHFLCLLLHALSIQIRLDLTSQPCVLKKIESESVYHIHAMIL
jgi:hypothetical protein